MNLHIFSQPVLENQNGQLLFFCSESSRFFRSTLGATSSSWRLVLWRQTSQNTIETPKGFAEDTPQFPQHSSESSEISPDLEPNSPNSCGQIEPRTLVDFGSQTKILEEKLCLNFIISFKKTIEAMIPRSKRQNPCNLKIYPKLCCRGSGCFETLDFQVGTTHWAREGAIREGCWGSKGMYWNVLWTLSEKVRRFRV